MLHRTHMNALAAGLLFAAGTSFLCDSAIGADRYQKPADEICVEGGIESYYTQYNFNRTREEGTIPDGSGYYLFSLPLTLEARHYLSDAIYLAPYARASITYDFADKPLNRSYWNNNQVFAGGLKLTTQRSFMNKSDEYVGGISASLFSEYEVMTSSFDRTKDRVPAGIERQNVKSGLSFWFSTQKPLNPKFRVWTESWGELAWHTTAFSDEGEDDFLIGSLSSKIGTGVNIAHASFEPYVTVDLVNDFLDREWNRSSWFNNVQYGPGARLVLDQYLPGNVSIYMEYLFVSYFDTPQDQDHDIKAGISCWIPIF
ncbi:MAG: hypothetical protein A3K90_04735 [Pelodictyon luteolum]|uniref:Transporter n=1 Tax=Pelodictyon luteolum TaxID=1100 RepID=A0A165M304_PELLU|nr:hypothetical protein [Pelodictyon luteolum]KZK74753.1 MAG: hypothetical protein A3K90_04735 [Pelodictyon luteolum]